MACRTVRLCRWDLKVNSLWLWFYCLLTLAAHAYLMYRAVLSCKNYNELPWDTEEKPVSELYAYIALVVVSIMCVPFFLITSIFKVGCYSNDGTRLGRDNVLHHLNTESVDEDEKAPAVGRFMKELWRHLGPLTHCCHVVAGFVLLIPLIVTEAQKVKHGFLDPDKMWSSELDVLFGKSVYTLSSPPPDVISSKNSTLTGVYLAPPTPTPELLEAGPIALSPEFVNYLIAMVIYSLRYAAVFWYTNATFSATFAAILLLATLHNVFAYCGMGILYKFSVNLHAVGDIELVLSGTAVMFLYLSACTIMFGSMLAVFNYGYCQYVDSCRGFLKTHFPTYARYVAKMPVGCQGYVPHLLATIALIMYVALRAPVVYDYVSLYRKTGFSILLTCIVMDAIYMLFWIGLWFAFTVKQTWEFTVNPQMDIIQQPRRSASALAVASTRQNGHTPQAEVTVIRTPGEDDPSNHGYHKQNDVNDMKHASNFEDDEDLKDHTNSNLSDDVDDIKVPDADLPKVEKPSSQNGKPQLHIDVNQSQDSTDALEEQVQTPLSPTSAMKKSGLRKSGERRHHQPQRVTFDESVDQIGPNKDADNCEEKKPVQFTPRKKKPRDKPVERFYDPVWSGNNHVSKQQPEPMHPEKTKSGQKHRHPEHEDHTPENTLTRNYRHSLRDKCGQYYKENPPAAQSSPLPRNRPLSDSYDVTSNNDEILLNPITAGSGGGKYGNNNNTLTSPSQKTVSPDYFHQRAKSSDARYNPRVGADRLRDPNRLSGRKQNEDSRAFSYPPQLSPSHRLPEKHQTTRKPSPTTPYSHKSHHQQSHLHQKSPHSLDIHLNDYSPSSHSPNSSKDISNNSTSSGGTVRDPKMYLQLNSHYDTPRSLKVPLSRPLKINMKPDLARRDSGMPSSNETSSNESAEHVLCSQV